MTIVDQAVGDVQVDRRVGLERRSGFWTARAHAQVEKCTTKNGDVNADGRIDFSDAVSILRHIFFGDPAELVPICDPTEDSLDCRTGCWVDLGVVTAVYAKLDEEMLADVALPWQGGGR